MPPDEYQNLLFETSPFGNADAIVEHDDRVVFFYLQLRNATGDRQTTRACWVRNLVAGPLVVNKQEMEQGIPPLLPRTHCHHQQPRPLPDPERLEVVWFEEGNGAALFEAQQLLAVIPPWSGTEGFHGYAAECAAESPICWPLPGPASNALTRRIEAAREFWQAFGDEPTPFARRQQALLENYRQRFGIEGDYFAIDGGQFPPRGMLSLDAPERWRLLTVGMSLVPQPNVEMMVDQPAWHRRIELGFDGPADLPDQQRETIRNRFAAIAAYPWRELTWLGPGHTVEWLPDPLPADQPGTAAVLVSDSYLAELRQTDSSPSASNNNLTAPLPDFRGDPVNLLWLIPLSTNERQQLQQGDSLSDLNLAPSRLPSSGF